MFTHSRAPNGDGYDIRVFLRNERILTLSCGRDGQLSILSIGDEAARLAISGRFLIFRDAAAYLATTMDDDVKDIFFRTFFASLKNHIPTFPEIFLARIDARA